MVESARIDKYSHSLDWERAVYDTILLDNAVKVAKDFAAKANDTLVIVVPDHAHMVGIIGSYDDDLPGQTCHVARLEINAPWPAHLAMGWDIGRKHPQAV